MSNAIVTLYIGAFTRSIFKNNKPSFFSSSVSVGSKEKYPSKGKTVPKLQNMIDNDVETGNLQIYSINCYYDLLELIEALFYNYKMKLSIA